MKKLLGITLTAALLILFAKPVTRPAPVAMPITRPAPASVPKHPEAQPPHHRTLVIQTKHL